jgi:hypothetical protein
MYKFEPSQSNEEIFKVVHWHLLVERFQEVFDYELTELMKQVDWALAISIALLSALLLNGRAGQATPAPVYEKLFLGALLASVIAGVGAKVWPVQYRYSKPTDTPVRSRLSQMRSPVLKEGPFEELNFSERSTATFEVSLTLSRALGLGKRVPKKILQGADESVEALKSFRKSLWWKHILHWVQLACTFLAIAGFSVWLLLD